MGGCWASPFDPKLEAMAGNDIAGDKWSKALGMALYLASAALVVWVIFLLVSWAVAELF